MTSTIQDIRQHGSQAGRFAAVTRSTAYLSDGTMVVGFLDVNQSDTTGDGGDSTGISKLYIYQGTNAVPRVWTLKNTITIGASALNARAEAWSMAIDASNNLHIAYVRKSDNAVMYIKATYSAGTWTPAAAVVAITGPGASIAHTRVDIDAIGTGSDNPVIVAYRNNTSGSPSIGVSIAVKNNSAVWTAATTWTVHSGASAYSASDSISVAASHEAAPDGTGNHYFCIAGHFYTTTGVDYQIQARVYQVSLTTGVVANTVTLSPGSGNPALTCSSAVGKTVVFYRGATSNNKKWIITNSQGAAGWDVGDIAKLDACIGYSVDASMVATNDLAYSNYWTRGNYFYDQTGWVLPSAVTFNKADGHLMFQFNSYNVLYNRVFTFNGTGFDRYNFMASDEVYYTNTTGGAHPAGVVGNPQSRNTDSNSVDQFVLTANPSSAMYYYYLSHVRSMNTGATCTVQTPAAGSTINVNRPALTPGYESGALGFSGHYPARRVKMQVQFATDAGFTTNLRDFTEPNSYFEVPGNGWATSYSGPFVSSLPFTITSSLFQGTWYCRARVIDAFGQISGWSTTQTYVVSHPPTPTNMQPAVARQVLIYGQPTTFSWSFSDTALPYDAQTAYQVQVYRVSDGAAVYDSGKVVSTGTSAQTTISATYKDTDLYFQVRLWDSDDVAGSYVVSAGYILVTDPPAPTISSPSGAISTGIPTVTWNPVLASGKTQAAYRVLITKAGVTVWDTGWVASAATSVQVPPQTLTNTTSYSIAVSVRDNYSLEGTGTAAFNTSYTLPGAPASGSVYLVDYRSRGFVYISVDPTGYDTDFQSYNLYRRKYGTSTWVNIKSWYDPTSRMVYQDYTATPNTTWEYGVTQMVNRFGDRVESTMLSLRTVTPADDKYWVLSSTNADYSFPLFNVTDDGYTDEYETETYHVIGRGRHTEFGDRLGLKGSMTARLRDRMISGVAKVNYIKNAQINVRTSDNADPTSWVTESGGTVGSKLIAYQGGNEPHPTGDPEALAVIATAMGTTLNTDYVGVYQDLSRSEQPFIAGDSVTFSVYIGGLPTAVNVNLIVIAYNSSNGVLSTTGDTVAVTPTEYYFNSPVSGDPDFGAGLPVQYWARYARTVTLPANFDHIRVMVRMRGTGSGTAGLQKTLLVTGAQLEKAAAATSYVDGNQFGGQWRGDIGLAGAETTGYYTARQMKQRIENFKLRKETGYLRTPFGDIYTVTLDDVQVGRIAGVGANEFVDVQIPYTEVAF